MISFQENMFQGFTVVEYDEYDIVWYGSINFLGYSKKEANVMRINNRDLAVEITGTINKSNRRGFPDYPSRSRFSFAKAFRKEGAEDEHDPQ